MADRPKFFDDLAGLAGGAMSALAGAREEIEAMIRARIDEALRRLELVRREELDAIAELAANARAGQEAGELRLTEIMARLAALERRAQPAGAAAAPAGPEGGPEGGFDAGGSGAGGLGAGGLGTGGAAAEPRSDLSSKFPD